MPVSLLPIDGISWVNECIEFGIVNYRSESLARSGCATKLILQPFDDVTNLLDSKQIYPSLMNTPPVRIKRQYIHLQVERWRCSRRQIDRIIQLVLTPVVQYIT